MRFACIFKLGVNAFCISFFNGGGTYTFLKEES